MDNPSAITPDLPHASNYLNLFRLSNNRYVIGIFQPGITILRQQCRSFNLFHALVLENVIPKNNSNFTIGIIGGGIAGVTFAAAAIKFGVKVLLLESKPILMPMQQGCDTRLVHPYIYDWPKEQSTFPRAKVPILSWKNDTASNVTKQILNEFYKLEEEVRPSQKLKIVLDCGKKIETYEKNDSIYLSYVDPAKKIEEQIGDHKPTIPVNLLIYATGYGIEKEVDNKPNSSTSYWRNDEFGQQYIGGGTKTFSISGTGDGSFADLFRLKFRNFSHESFVLAISKDPNYVLLVTELNKIKNEWNELCNANKDKNVSKDWLFDKLYLINPDYYNYIYRNFFSNKVNSEIKVFLLGKEEKFRNVLKLSQVSMLNAFIAFILDKDGSLFEYKKATNVKYKSSKKAYTSTESKELEGTVIIRHGTDRINWLKNTLDSAELRDEANRIKGLQENSNLYNETKLLWTYSSLYNLLHSNNNPTKNHYFYTPETQLFFSSSIASLASSLKDYQKKKFNSDKIRICLHRVLKHDRKWYYQRIIPYFGFPENYKHTGVGHIYLWDTGIVGLACKSGKSIVIMKEDDFVEIPESLCVGGLNDGNSAIAVPILAENKTGEYTTNLVLFVESIELSIFTQPTALAIIRSSITGLIEYIENSVLGYSQLVMSDIDYEPVSIDENFDFRNSESLNSFKVYSSTLETTDNKNQELIYFKKHYSFDISLIPTIADRDFRLK